jgi:hypothetical protein
MQGTRIFEMKNQRPPAQAKNPIMLNSYLNFVLVKSCSILSEFDWRSLLPVVLFFVTFELLLELLIATVTLVTVEFYV